MAADAQAVIEAPALQSKYSDAGSEESDFNSDENVNNSESVVTPNGAKDSLNAKSDSYQMQHIVDMLKKLKLNPLAKEFVPSYCYNNRDQMLFVPANKTLVADAFPNNRRQRGNNYNQGRRRMNNRAFRAQREDSIRRTVYVSDIDHNVTEERLAALFSAYGQVVDCRVCGDPHSRLRFAFVEFADEYSARAALSLCGTILGFSPLKVLPSKTAILPVNPTFLPRSEDEREMCARTVYCTNIDKKVSQADVKNFPSLLLKALAFFSKLNRSFINLAPKKKSFNNQNWRMSSTSRTWITATSLGVVEALKDQGICRWNYTIRAIHQHAKNNLRSYSQAKKLSSQSSSLFSANTDVKEKVKQSEESLRKVMYLTCWGPN